VGGTTEVRPRGELERHGIDDTSNHFIQKPMPPAALVGAVRQIPSGKAAAAA
jgi:hypothetical protein